VSVSKEGTSEASMTYRGTKLALTKENALDLLRKKPKAPTKKLVEQAPKVVSKVQVQN
jgi:hypothetical protein